MSEKPNSSGSSRREFLATAAAATAAVSAGLSWVPSVHAAGDDVIKVGLIGCGGRGTGAAENVLHSAPNVEIVALGDVFQDRLDGCRNRLKEIGATDGKVKELGNKVSIKDENCFVGLDAYEKVIGSDANYIILATPPGFRPIHLQAAVAAGKNIFTEKPVGVDGPGIRKVLEAYEEALKKKLAIAAGTQRRHQLPYIETLQRLHDGEIGDIVAGRCYWNQGILWKRERKPGMSDVAFQIHNWYGYPWLCGDHIVEQHVHNLDVMCWAIGAHPEKAVGMGYRTRTDPGYGVIYDFFAIDFTFPKDVHVLSMCRQISECANSVSEAVVGTKGHCQVNAYTINGKRVLSKDQEKAAVDPYVQEHTDLITSIRAGKPINELKQVAESTLTAIMGRMSAYTGKEVTWDKALNSKLQLMPEKLTWDMSLEVPPVAVPGKTPLV
jgi:myo-inositol 2-dehydrogenase / D-chiro-inositol 1-dehydrogenase